MVSNIFNVQPLYGIFTYMYLVDFYGFHIPFHASYGRHFWIGNVKIFKIPKSPSQTLWKNIISCEFGPPKIVFGQIKATSHGPPKGSWGREIPLFPGHLGWWNIIIWPDFIYAMNQWKIFCCLFSDVSTKTSHPFVVLKMLAIIGMESDGNSRKLLP